MKHFLRKWLKTSTLSDDDFDVKNILDWDYYRERLSKTIQKIITIPAALQDIENPVPRIPHPDWLAKTVRRRNDRYQQMDITSMFSRIEKKPAETVSPSAVTDIEDISRMSRTEKRPMVHSRKKKLFQKNKSKSKLKYDETVDEVEPPTMQYIPLPKTPKTSKEVYQEWLLRKKMIWRKDRREHKILKKRMRDNPVVFNEGKNQRRKPISMESYLREKVQAVTQQEWHVIEVSETQIWVMLNNSSMQKISIHIPRIIYINCRTPIKELQLKELQSKGSTEEKIHFTIKKVEKDLPHSKMRQHLYEISMSEDVFQRHCWQDQLLSTLQTDPHDLIEGVYETRTPLLFRALLHLGSVSKVSSPKEDIKKHYNLTDLMTVKKPKEGRYLHSNLSYRRIFLYEALHHKRKTGLVALFIMDTANPTVDITEPCNAEPDTYRIDAKCLVWFVQPSGTATITQSQCQNIFGNLLGEMCQQAHQKSDCESEYDCLSKKTQCVFESVDFVMNAESAMKKVNGALKAFQQKKYGPTLLISNATKPISFLRKSIPNCSEFPIISLPFPPGPAHSQSSLLPAIQWESEAMQLSLEAYIHMATVSYPRRVRSARYGNLPIGNFGLDESTTLFDITFARQLSKSRSLLWTSEVPGSPDLGSGIMASAGDASDSLSNINVWGDDDEMVSPVISSPGAFRNICIEIDLQDLAISAITDPSYINVATKQIGASTDSGVFDSANQQASTLGDEMSCSKSFGLLRNLVLSWMNDARDQKSLAADDLLHDIYRLVCSQSTFLHDPALHRLLHSLMKSNFYRLLGELQRLGATIVKASFSSITVSTNKSELSAANEYINFVISTILKSHGGQFEGLARLSLRPTNFWCHYLFLDEYNFGGILFEPIDDQTEHDSKTVVKFDSSTYCVPAVVCGWNIMQYLAGELHQEYFKTVIARYSKDLYDKEAQIHRKLNKQGIQPLEAQHLETHVDKSAKEQLVQYKKKLVANHFASYMTRAVGEIEKEGSGPESFPNLPGSHLSLTNPALEFIKSVIVVLQLDKDVEYEVQILKRNLLSQIGLQEYSTLTVWENPCATFILPDLCCMECHDVRDTNLCILTYSDDNDEKCQWRCSDCGTPYDKDFIEWRLVHLIQRKSALYQLQDLRCSKTQRVALRALGRQSKCSADLKLDITREHFASRLSILRNLAKYHQLDWLLETVNGLMGNFSE